MNDAMGDIIAGLEPGMAAGGEKDLDLTAFSDLVDRANFVSLNSADRKTKSFIRRLRRADRFTKCDKIGVSHAFLFAKTFKHWYPNGTDRKRLTKLLRSRRMFRSGRRHDTSLAKSLSPNSEARSRATHLRLNGNASAGSTGCVTCAPSDRASE